jgi:hypothetical protein
MGILSVITRSQYPPPLDANDFGDFAPCPIGYAGD